jgi:AcrR family transcriptional regulator
VPDNQRADARRNRDQLLAVAAEAVAEQGVEVSLRDVARRAGVGIGTLYRHFPTREALLEAVFRSRFDRLRDRGAELLDAADPRQALLSWLADLAGGAASYRGLPESVLVALHDEGSELHASCHAMRAAASALLDRAQRAGAVRPDVAIDEVLALTAGVAWASGHTARPDTLDRLLTLTMTGLTTTDSPP